MKGYIALIGLGAIGSPLAHRLYCQYKDQFILLSSENIAKELRKQPVYINGLVFSPRIVTPTEKLNQPIRVVFVCVKNYSLTGAADAISPMIDRQTIILPLQNGVFSYRFFRETFPDNTILEGYAQGPNTRIFENNIVYQNPGEYHLGTHHEKFRSDANEIYSLLKNAGIPCQLEQQIRHSIWKKMMLNVAGNAITALTGLDYMMFKSSTEAQELCRFVMDEYALVAKKENIYINQEDINDVLTYFTSYNRSKHTSMLEDVLRCRETENEFLAGYIYKLAQTHRIQVPHIYSIYTLMRIKEDVYLGKLN